MSNKFPRREVSAEEGDEIWRSGKKISERSNESRAQFCARLPLGIATGDTVKLLREVLWRSAPTPGLEECIKEGERKRCARIYPNRGVCYGNVREIPVRCKSKRYDFSHLFSTPPLPPRGPLDVYWKNLQRQKLNKGATGEHSNESRRAVKIPGAWLQQLRVVKITTLYVTDVGRGEGKR